MPLHSVSRTLYVPRVAFCKSPNTTSFATEDLALHRNKIAGSIPTALSELSNLREFGMGGNTLTGSIPTEILRLSSLEYLELSENLLTGSIPTRMGALTNLSKSSVKRFSPSKPPLSPSNIRALWNLQGFSVLPVIP